MKKTTITLLLIGISAAFLNGCGNHPKDRTNFDDLIHCGFGQEYVSGYTKSNGTKVAGYCRDQN